MAAFQASARARQHQQLLSISRNPSYLDDDAVTRTTQTQTPLFTPDTEEWVVFSPSVAGETNTILSGTGTKSDVDSSIITTSSPQHTRHVPVFEDEEEEEEEESLDGAETDSLQAFRDQEDQVLFPTLPTHDGLGTFASSSGMTGFRSLEESLRLAAANEQGREGDDTHSRIMKWRMEQGHALMDEIEKATRRRRRLSIISRRNTHSGRASRVGEGEKYEEAVIQETDDETQSEDEEEDATNETFWKRITRSFIRDIIGIDDNLLEVLFGEALPAEVQLDSSSEEVQFKKDTEERILNRIAKELGELVHLYTHHPSGTGAFSKAPEGGDSEEEDGAKTPQPRTTQEATISPKVVRPRGSSLISAATGTSSVPQFQFAPTLALRREEAHHASLWGIEENDDLMNTQLRREYWEQELDMRLVFSYLKSRFYGLPPRPPTTSSASAATTTTTSSAPLHHHHPLINGKHSYYNRKSTTTIAPSTTAANAAAAPVPAPGGFFGNFIMGNLKMGGNWAERVTKDRRGSKASSRSRGGYYWGVATSVGSGQSSCVGTGIWAAI
ncbi:hypothetical protein BZA05DRAFT_140376 [Tricharina praecox]|uniref:uncharacterized protein n=1 Tax=Tricharina praecox TaxID=43433 RepID=UPI00221F78F4|nr:uncharacterized protein BZA05DRAFT_140376 [Tricharina praecox]KAI5846165.1 hypothetical protein BZA05DRAFT_140376 [Tricharina praecox]